MPVSSSKCYWRERWSTTFPKERVYLWVCCEAYKWNPMSYRYACNVYLSPVRYPRFKTLQLPRFSLKARTCGGFMWFVEWFPSTRKVNRLYLKTSNLTQWGWYLTTTGILEFIPICNLFMYKFNWLLEWKNWQWERKFIGLTKTHIYSYTYNHLRTHIYLCPLKNWDLQWSISHYLEISHFLVNIEHLLFLWFGQSVNFPS